MITKTKDLIRIKQTKSVEMYYDEEGNYVYLKMIDVEGMNRVTIIPISKAFQVKRGLESAVQRFYRKKKRLTKKT